MSYELGPVIGKLGGGADVQKTPVNIVADGGGSKFIMHTVHVPEGEIWLVVLVGDLAPYSVSVRSGPVIFIGEVSLGPDLPAGHTSIAAEVTGTAEISLRRNTTSGSDRFVGHLYIVPLPQ